MNKILLLLLLSIFIPSTVTAHVYLKKSIPADAAVLRSSPDKVVMIFSKSVNSELSWIKVYDHKGKRVSKGTRFAKNDSVMEVDLISNLRSGEYIVKVLCVTIGGHKQKLSKKFVIAQK